MVKVGDILAGKYEILKEIGHGGMSIVYLAMDQNLNKQWAVKEIRKEMTVSRGEILRESLLAEANLMKRLDHHALPRIVDIMEDEEMICIVMDYIEGESLDKVVEAMGPLSEAQVIDIALQICDVLDYLHHQEPPIIYRDIKPANIMLKPDGRIKIIDFGTAREYKDSRQGDTRILGTRGYAPPEQYEGQTNVRSDIFALGMTIHYLLTGYLPAAGQERIPLPLQDPSLSEGIDYIVERCTQLSQEQRYASCQEVSFDLTHPELVTKSHKIKQKLKLTVFMINGILSVLFFSAAILCHIAGTRANDYTYEALITQSSATSFEQKIKGCREAISLYPWRTQAYLEMLSAFEDEGHFNQADSDLFLALYNANKFGFETDRDTALLNYKAGMMYLNYFSGQEEEKSIAAAIQKAWSFFSANHDMLEEVEDFEYMSLSEAYYRICFFYKKYILRSASVDEAGTGDYEALLEDMEMLGRAVARGMPGANDHDLLAVAHGVYMLAYDQRQGFAAAGIEAEEILNILEEIREAVYAMKVTREQSLKLRSDILDNDESFRQGILSAYDDMPPK